MSRILPPCIFVNPFYLSKSQLFPLLQKKSPGSLRKNCRDPRLFAKNDFLRNRSGIKAATG